MAEQSIVDKALDFARDVAKAAGDLAADAASAATAGTEQLADAIEAYVTEQTGSAEAGAKARQEFMDRVL